MILKTVSNLDHSIIITKKNPGGFQLIHSMEQLVVTWTPHLCGLLHHAEILELFYNHKHNRLCTAYRMC